MFLIFNQEGIPWILYIRHNNHPCGFYFFSMLKECFLRSLLFSIDVEVVAYRIAFSCLNETVLKLVSQSKVNIESTQYRVRKEDIEPISNNTIY